MKKIIGIVGLKKKYLARLKRKYNKFNFIDINDNNLFSNKSLSINALVVLYEYPVKKKLSLFLKRGFKRFKYLEWLHLTRAGIDECIPFLKDYKFTFTSGKKIQAPNVSEHCVSLLLSLTRSLFDQNNAKNYKFRPTEISGQKILIVGLGGIGSEIAKKLYNFNCKVYSINRSLKKNRYVEKNYSISKLKYIINKFDIIINSLPLTKDTIGIFDRKVFNKMKNKCFFISISRDKTINLKDFKFFLKKNKFAGVAIDTTGSFKISKRVVFQRKYNFLLTNHLGGETTDNLRRTKLIYENINAFASGKKLKYLVSKTKGY